MLITPKFQGETAFGDLKIGFAFYSLMSYLSILNLVAKLRHIFVSLLFLF